MEMNFLNLREDEVIDDLMINNLKVFQKKKGFKFGIDAVLISNFASDLKADKVLDIGTGTGIIPILLAGKYNFRKVSGIEIQKVYYEMAVRSVEYNKLKNKINIINGDIQNYKDIFLNEKFDMIISNPPYKVRGSGIINENNSKTIARHEITFNFDELVKAVKFLLKPNGEFVLVHRPDRMVDIFYNMRKNKIEPKYIKLVCSRIGKAPKLVLIKGKNNGNKQLNFLPPLYIYNSENSYTEELNKIYFG
jgi:tRNA1(Val) A37 N6-methylase TrmN6